MKASKDYMLDRYGMERYRAIEELTEIMNRAQGKDFTKYYIAKRVRAWITPIGTKCWAPHAVFENPLLFIEQLILKFQKEAKGSILKFRIKRKNTITPYTLENIFFARTSKNDNTAKRIVSTASVSDSSD